MAIQFLNEMNAQESAFLYVNHTSEERTVHLTLEASVAGQIVTTRIHAGAVSQDAEVSKQHPISNATTHLSYDVQPGDGLFADIPAGATLRVWAWLEV